jgi:hypothetical protein
MSSTTNQMLLGIYETLSAHNKAVFENLNAARALVAMMKELDPKSHAVYQRHHLALVAQTASLESASQSLIDGMLQELRKPLKGE